MIPYELIDRWQDILSIPIALIIVWRDFNQDVLLERKTYHHSIPKVFRPKFNVKVPVCQECHYAMNPINDKMIIAFLRRARKSFDNFLAKYEVSENEYSLKISDELKKLMKDIK